MSEAGISFSDKQWQMRGWPSDEQKANPFPEEMIIAVFAVFDSNNDQRLSLEEFIKCFRTHSCYEMCESDAYYNMLLEYGGQAGEIEARFASMNKKLLMKYDKSKTGYLSKDELRVMINAFGKDRGQGEIPDEILEEMFEKLDANHDGKLSIDEIATLMREEVIEMCDSEEHYKEVMGEFGLEI